MIHLCHLERQTLKSIKARRLMDWKPALLQAAKGGVLFIDEAYELGKGLYGQEACTAIVAAMTDPKYAGRLLEEQRGSLVGRTCSAEGSCRSLFEDPVGP